MLIDEDGHLEKYGLRFKGVFTCTKCHPDKDFIFAGYQVAYYDEAVVLATKNLAFLYASCSIGWYIAITDTGL